MSERSIFVAALEKDDPAERDAYLDQACADDLPLRQRIERLLKAHQPADSFLENRPPGLGMTVDQAPITERPGAIIGPYKLMEQIGDGGMGVVFVAEQQDPVRRRVALKIIKPGMDSAQVIARFEAERQALALMDHQNIAKVYDAGTTASGRPYFVMELVHGVPITDYCDANKLTPRQRLELFIPVCQAIQHAHHKGIIHRDIKPSNILVTMYDDKPVPKVIDFGVAKAIEQRLTEKTVYTQFGTLVGTLEYMSPEQAEMNAFGVDTRSDVYALGVLLYELLTGTTPLERQRLREAAFDEIRRIIKEEEPQRPSIRLSTSGTLAKVAEARKTDPAKLSRLMRGELDWVVMKCLEKDRSRRYDSASNLARDVERFLQDEPVEARPPSSWYRFSKVVKRNKTAFLVTGLIAALVLIGTAAIVWQASEADAVRRADEKRHKDELAAERRQYALDRAIEAAFSGDLKKARQAIRDAYNAGVEADQVYWLNGLVHFQRGDQPAAIKEFQSALALKPTVAAQAMLVRAYIHATTQGGGNFAEEYIQALTTLRMMKPVTPEDYMCRGFAMPPSEREQRMTDLNTAIAKRDSPIARTFRAHTACTIGLSLDDLKLVESGLDDVQQAKFRLGDNPFVRFSSAYGQLNASILYGEAGQSNKQKDALAEAKNDLDALKDIPVSAFVHLKAISLELDGKEDDALKLLEQAVAREETKEIAWYYVMALYRKGQVEKALKVLDESRQPENFTLQLLRIILLSELSQQYGPDKAFEEYRALMRRERDKGRRTLGRYEHYPLLFLGKRPEAAELLRGVASDLKEAQSLDPLVEYVEGKMSEETFLTTVAEGRFFRCRAHYLIGLVRLSEGDRDGARDHFRKAVATKQYFVTHYYPMSCIFLERLENDKTKTWPTWIQVKK